MKMKTMLMVAMVCFVGANVFANIEYQLQVTADSYISYASPNDNFGAEGGLYHDLATSDGVEKSYLLFELPEAIRDKVIGVQSISYLYGGSVSRTIEVSLIEQADGIDDWTEDGITWNNAPGNNMAGGVVVEFVAYPGEELKVLGRVATAGSPGWKTRTFTEAQGDAVLNALTNDDFKVTIGARLFSTNTGVWFRSSEFEGNTGDVYFAAGEAAPYLTLLLIPEPATLVLLGMGGLALLRKRK